MKLVDVEAKLSFTSPLGNFRQGARYEVDAEIVGIKALLAVGYLSLTCEEEGNGAADSAGTGVVSGADLGTGVAGQEAQGAGEGVDGADRPESRRSRRGSSA